VTARLAPGKPDPAADPAADPAPDHDIAAVLRIVNFRRLWLALGLSSFGDWLGLLATAALARQLAAGSYTAENFAIAGVFIVRLLPAVLLGPLAGVLADRFDRKWNLVIGDVVRFGLFASIPLVGTLTWLFIATVLVEIAALFWMPAKDASVPNLVPPNRLEAANQLGLVATYGTAPLAALVYAGLAVVTAAIGSVAPVQPDPVTVALYLNALTFLVSGLTIWRLQIPPATGRQATRERGVIGSILDGWRFVGRTRVVRGLVLGMLGAFAAAGFVVGLAQTFVADLGAGQPGFGLLFGAVFVGLAVGMWTGPRLLQELSRRRIFGAALTAAGLFLIGLALSANLVLATVLTLAVGACGGVAWVTGQTLLGLEVDDEVRGRTFAFLQSSARVVLVLVLAAGPALAAPLGTRTLRLPSGMELTYSGAAWVFLLAGVLATAMGVTAYRQMDDRRGVRLRDDLRAALFSGAERAPTVPGGRLGGVLVAFEGGDGAGKSTQAQMLARWLRDDQGHEVVLTREPGATPLGVRLRELLLGERGQGADVGARAEALLFAADRAHHVETVVRPALERGAVVVTDRYVDSSIAYQGAGRELAPQEVARLSKWATQGLVPDLTVLLDLPPEFARVRRAAAADGGAVATGDRIESLDEGFHERVRAGFLDLARREPQRYLVLDGSQDRDEVQEEIRRRLRLVLPVSGALRDQLHARLSAEDEDRARRARAESDVRRLDAELRGRMDDEATARERALRRAREEAERAAATQAGPDGDPAGLPTRSDGTA